MKARAEKINKIEFTGDVWAVGGSQVVTVKGKKAKDMELNNGETVKVTIERVFK